GFGEADQPVDGFGETTHAIPGTLIEAVHDAYVGDPMVRAFILRENPAAAKIIAERFLSARRRGLWHPLRNSIDDDLTALIAVAEALGVAA
ncbi:cobaltochelatase subunit CobN, partial [Mesorhizobium sp. M7A.F.Ca.CA.002.03.2.1]|uniref:cobaltochelatase subunit CobN n=1 Tax=Mesorhizobium sp. M7A.F.Ca.CA.002.03.2.1 TaxID=2496680 RepID=UPI000FD2F299